MFLHLMHYIYVKKNIFLKCPAFLLKVLLFLRKCPAFIIIHLVTLCITKATKTHSECGLLTAF